MGVLGWIALLCLTAFVAQRTASMLRLPTRRVAFDGPAAAMIDQYAASGSVRLIAVKPSHYLPAVNVPRAAEGDVLFVEVHQGLWPAMRLQVHGGSSYGYGVLWIRARRPAHAIAGLLLAIRDRTGRTPHLSFGWAERGHTSELVRFLLFGSGYLAPVTRDLLRRSEPDATQRPTIHIG